MIPELGLFMLILALLVSIVQAMGVYERFAPLAPRAAFVQFGLVAGSFLALTYSYIVTDLSVANVIANSHSLKPLIYRIAGVWGNHEGSILLWILVLAGFGAFVAVKDRTDPAFTAKVLGVQGMIGAGFILFALLASDPFERVGLPPVDGRGLNPVLQDPALAIHPPLLYGGYVGFSVAFSYAAAALLAGKFDAEIVSRLRLWVILAWTSLSAGIALGSWWAYYELGWGGWWFWDPVENASLMPWLSGTALLHSAIVTQHRQVLKRWTLLLAILTFGLSLLGTFLVRSGVLTSVHAFATDPMRGLFILGLLMVYTGGALTLYGMRAGRLDSPALFAPISREGALVLNNLFLSTACATVFIGTLYPLILSAFNLGQISVGPPYFHATFVPLCVPMLILMGVAPFIPWKQGDAKTVSNRIAMAVLTTGFVTLIILGMQTKAPYLSAAGLGLSAWLVAASILDFIQRTNGLKWERVQRLPLSQWSMTLAHMGLGVAIAGMIGSSLWVNDNAKVMKQGETMKVGGYTLTLKKIEPVFGENYSSVMAFVEAAREGGKTFAVMKPERRRFPVAGQTTTEAAIRQSLHDDLYVTLGERDTNGGWVIRAWTHPLAPYLWIGYMMIALGGLLGVGGRLCRKNY